VRTVVFAYHSIGCIGLEQLLRHGYEVAAVFTHPDAGSGEEVWWPSVARRARSLGIPVYERDRRDEPGLAELVAALAPEILFSFYYRHLLSAEVLAMPPRGALNLHGSLLPRGRGRAPVNWSLVHGDARTGVSLHYMVEKADAGDLVDQEAVAIAIWDTALTLYEKLERATVRVLERALPALAAGTAIARPQDLAKGTYWGRRRPRDGAIDWSWPAGRIYDLVRAVTHPYPGAFCRLDGDKLILWWAVPAGEVRPGAPPGSILELGRDGIDVAAGDGALRLQMVQLEGCPEQPAVAFFHARGLGAGDRLEDGLKARRVE